MSYTRKGRSSVSTRSFLGISTRRNLMMDKAYYQLDKPSINPYGLRLKSPGCISGKSPLQDVGALGKNATKIRYVSSPKDSSQESAYKRDYIVSPLRENKGRSRGETLSLRVSLLVLPRWVKMERSGSLFTSSPIRHAVCTRSSVKTIACYSLSLFMEVETSRPGEPAESGSLK